MTCVKQHYINIGSLSEDNALTLREFDEKLSWKYEILSNKPCWWSQSHPGLGLVLNSKSYVHTERKWIILFETSSLHHVHKYATAFTEKPQTLLHYQTLHASATHKFQEFSSETLFPLLENEMDNGVTMKKILESRLCCFISITILTSIEWNEGKVRRNRVYIVSSPCSDTYILHVKDLTTQL